MTRFTLIFALILLSLCISACSRKQGKTKMTYFSTIDSGYRSESNDWSDFLNCVSRKSEYGVGNNLFQQKESAHWLLQEANVFAGFAPIALRTGKKIPKSYLHFLMVTQGIYKLSFAGTLPNSNFWPLTSLKNFHEEMGEKERIAPWSDISREATDQDYYVYGVEREGKVKSDPFEYAGNQVSELIVVGYIDGDGFIALNPAEISSDGEWEAWYLDWGAMGVKRFRSFAELFQNIAYTHTENPKSAGPYSAALLRASCASLIQTAALTD